MIYTFPQVVRIVLVSMSLVTLGFFGFMHLRAHTLECRRHDPKYEVHLIVQSAPKSHQLPTALLSKILQLSREKPVFLGDVVIQDKLHLIQQYGVFEQVSLKVLPTHGLWIDYILKKPIALCGNYANTLMDRSGSLFCCAPFFSHQTLPTVYFSKELITAPPWNQQIPDNVINDVLSIREALHPLTILSMDLTRMKASSLGSCETIITLQDARKTVLLRLSPLLLEEGLKEFLVLYDALLAPLTQNIIVELRIPKMAFWNYA